MTMSSRVLRFWWAVHSSVLVGSPFFCIGQNCIGQVRQLKFGGDRFTLDDFMTGSMVEWFSILPSKQLFASVGDSNPTGNFFSLYFHFSFLFDLFSFPSLKPYLKLPQGIIRYIVLFRFRRGEKCPRRLQLSITSLIFKQYLPNVATVTKIYWRTRFWKIFASKVSHVAMAAAFSTPCLLKF